MPDDPSEEELILIAKANVAKVKTQGMKKGLAKKKNMLSARKKDLLSKQVTPPAELTRFLQSDVTFDEVLKVADANIKDILVRRYVRISVFSTEYQLNPLQILDVLLGIHKFPATGSCG